MPTKNKIDVNKEFNILSVFFNDGTQTNQEPQTTDSSAVEAVLTANKVSSWAFVAFSIDITHNRIFISKDTYPEDPSEIEELLISSFTVEQQTTINNFINSL